MNNILNCGKRGLPSFMALVFAFISLLAMPTAQAATYVNASTTFNWIDASTHTKVGYNTVPYRFNALAGCGTALPVIDDTISDIIPLGFNFVFGDKVFDAIRIMTNGRIQFVSTTLPLDNTNCGYGSPVTYWPYPNAGLTYTMRIYGNDMDPTLQANYGTSSTPCKLANNCYVSFASIGTAPNRQFVVTWNNVPEWAGTTSNPAPTGNYNLQIILNEAGDFIYQYGTDTPGPSAALGQVGWEISTADFDTPTVGYPVPNTAIHFFIPHPVAEYLMEQPSWSGSGSVLDTSGNSQHGSPLGSAQTVAGGRVCRGASIPLSATGANAINTDLVVPTAIGNAGTIAFWYKANTAWTGPDALLLDATTVPNQFFQLVRRSNGRLRFVVTDSTGIHTVETAAIAVVANTWKHIAVTWNFNNLAVLNNDRLRIFVDGVQQQQTAFTSTTATLSSTIGSLYIGGTRNSLAAPSSTINSADATLDEFRAYNYEAVQATIAAIMNQNTGGCLNHYAIADAGTGLSCQLSPFTVSAHTGSHGAFVNNALVTLSTTDGAGPAGTGTWSLLNGHGFLINSGSNDGKATYLFNNESQVQLGLTHPATGSVTAHVTDGTYSELGTENPALVISSCAVGKFNACEVAATRCTPSSSSTAYANLFTKLSNTAFALDVVALRVNGTRDNAFNGTVSVNLLANTTAPTISASNNCPTSQVATISLGSTTLSGGRPPVGGVSVAANAFGSVSPNYSAYQDVRVQFVCTVANCGTAGTWCATDAFTVRPLSFTVSSLANADVSGVSTSLTPRVKAGATFTLTADTATAGYNGTPIITLTTAEWPSPPAPTGAIVGTVSGSFSPAVVATGIASDSFTYSEVGYFRFPAGAVHDDNFPSISGDVAQGDCTNDFSNTLNGGKYGCKIRNPAATNYFGRFIPDHFDTVVTPGMPCPTGLTCPTLLVANDQGFIYSGQSFTTLVTARNYAGSTTLNYFGGFAKAVTLAAWDALGSTTTQNPSGALTNNTITAATFAAGVATSTPIYTLTSATTTPVNIFMRASESSGGDSVTSLRATPASSVEGGVKVVSGRIKVSNAYGSELLPLTLTATAQYYASTGWLNSTTDSITKLTLDASYPVGSGSTTVTLNPVSGVLSSGLLSIKLGIPSAGAGAATITPTVVPGCLQVIPGTATFGVYKSNNNFIYRRESY